MASFPVSRQSVRLLTLLSIVLGSALLFSTNTSIFAQSPHDVRSIAHHGPPTGTIRERHAGRSAGALVGQEARREQ